MISIIIPFHNEKEDLPLLLKRLKEIGGKMSEKLEIILINDGSNDNSKSRIQSLEFLKDENVKLISHGKRLGKGKALQTGFNASQGDTIVFMDADLQDDPVDLPKFISKIDEGYDLVNGWRKYRQDPLSKTLPSSIFNTLLLRIFLQTKFHDVNCGFKAMKRKILVENPLYGDNYRFLPILAEKSGFKTTEVIVTHSPRMHGKSKYGFLRLLSGLLDTFTTYFIFKFSERPLHFFGIVGGIFFVVGFIISLILAFERIFYGVLLYRRPVLILGVLLIIVGIQIIMTGITAELIVYLNKKK